MDETNSEQSAEQSQQSGTQTGAEPGQQTETAASFTQADVERIVKERLARAESKAAEREQRARADAEAKALAEQGNFKTLYEKLQAEAAAKDAQLKALERKQLAGGVAARVGLPTALAERLQGETEEELEADAKALLAAIPKPTAPNINAGAGGGNNQSTLNAADAAELAAIYGVNPKYLGAGG